MQAFALWAFAKFLPPTYGANSKDVARSLRRQFALVGLFLVSGLVVTLWSWTSNIVVAAGTLVVMGAGLWLYSEHGAQPAA
ncbi:MAG: hypothetical protein ABI334_09545 [Candidatus Dormiibacterota bacterium]